MSYQQQRFTETGIDGTYLTPNIMGFMVGLYILRVERTMGGLGEKFEEALMAILPKAASYAVREETLDP